MDLTPTTALVCIALVAVVTCAAVHSMADAHFGKAVAVALAGIGTVLAVYFHTRIKQ